MKLHELVAIVSLFGIVALLSWFAVDVFCRVILWAASSRRFKKKGRK